MFSLHKKFSKEQDSWIISANNFYQSKEHRQKMCIGEK